MYRFNSKFKHEHCRYTEAQSALFDAILFIAILILASIVIHIHIAHPYAEASNRSYFIKYTEETREVVLRSTISEVSYTYNGRLIVLEDKSVLELLLEDLYIRSRTSDPAVLEAIEDGIERPIDEILKNLTYPYYQYALHAEVIPATGGGDVNLMIADTEHLPLERYASSTEAMMPDNGARARITLYIWGV